MYDKMILVRYRPMYYDVSTADDFLGTGIIYAMYVLENLFEEW